VAVAPLTLQPRVIAETKVEKVYPTHIHYRVLVPVGDQIEAYLTVPSGYAYLVVGEVHDVPSDYFTHRCVKDDMLVLPETLVNGTSTVINYPIPLLVEKYWKGIVKNVSDVYVPPGADTIFRLRVPFAVVRSEVVKVWKEEAEVRREVLEAFAAAWRRLGVEEKIEVVARVPELVALIAG